MCIILRGVKMKSPTCATVFLHEERVNRVKKIMPKEGKLQELADMFKVFGDSTRMKILYILSEEEMCVCDLASLIGISQSAISHQLRILKQARLVKYRRDGKVIFYSLDDDHVKSLIRVGMDHVNE